MGKKAGGFVSHHAHNGAVFALGQLGSVGGDEQRQVSESGHGSSERLEDEDVLEGVGEVILTANDV